MPSNIRRCDHRAGHCRPHMQQQRQHHITLLAITLVLITSISAIIHIHALSPSPSSSTSLNRPPSHNSAARDRTLIDGAAEILDFALNHMESTSSREQAPRQRQRSQHDTEDARDSLALNGDTPLQVIFSHTLDVLNSLYMPVDYLIHLAHGSHDDHPLTESICAAMVLFGYDNTTQLISSSVVESPDAIGRVRPSLVESEIISPIQRHTGIGEKTHAESDDTHSISADRRLLSTSFVDDVQLPANLHASWPPPCFNSGQLRIATRSSSTCLTPENDRTQSQTIAEYNEYETGSLLLVFKDEPNVHLDESITDDITCTQVWDWFTADGNNFIHQHVTTDPSQFNPTQLQDMLYPVCVSMVPLALNGSSEYNGDSVETQYCQLFVRCYQRQHFCHTWLDELPFCVCPYDQFGAGCEQFVPYTCEVTLVYPRMDEQTFRDEADTLQTYRCNQPSSGHTRFPSNADNPGVNSKAPLKPLTSTQERYGYLNHLDGERPCLEWPSRTNNPTIKSDTDRQEFRFALDCSFTTDDDPYGTSPIPSAPSDTNAPRWNRLREGPTFEVERYLQANNYTWDDDYSKGWAYDVIRRHPMTDQVYFAVSDVALNPLQLRLHPQNFVRLFDRRFDHLSLNASSTMLQSPPSDAAILDALTHGRTDALRDSTLGFDLSLTQLPSSFWPGGRLLLEVTIVESWAYFNYSTAPVTLPRGFIGAQYPTRIVIDQSNYQLSPPTEDHKLSILAIFILVLVGIAILGSAYKYYEYRKAEEFDRLVKRAKLHSRRRQQQIDAEQEQRRANRRREIEEVEDM